MFLTAKVARKVPHVIAIFWIVKILTTAMGEAVSDYFVQAINPIIAVGVAFAVLTGVLVAQIKLSKYVPWVYWLAVALVAVFGTMAADVLHKVLGVTYVASTVFFLISLAIVFTFWYLVEKNLSIHGINTRRRELFYWATVLATFALGTAAGDWTAFSLRLGFLVSGIFFAVIIAIPAVGFMRFGMNEVLAFWFAYIITRPLGASFADWFGKSTNIGGLGLGDGVVGGVLVVLIIILVAYLQITHRDIE